MNALKEEKVADEGSGGNKPPKPLPKTRGKTKFVVIGIIVLVVIALVVALPRFAGKKEILPAVDTAEVKTATVEDIVTLSGKVEASHIAKVMSASEYEITAIHVAEGDTVSAGDILARLDASVLQDQYRRTQASLQSSRFNYEASKELYAAGAISERELIQAESAYNGDRASLSSLHIDNKSVIKSPISGTVTRVNAFLGNNATRGNSTEPLFVIEDLSRLIIKVNVAEYDIGRIAVGQSVTITSDILGRKEAVGVVSHIASTGEAKAAGSNEMIIPVEIEITEGNGLIAGVAAKVNILAARSENVKTVPIDTVVEDPADGSTSVFVVTADGVLKSVPVTEGVKSTLAAEILSGDLNLGDRVVLSPDIALTDGTAVEVLTVDGESVAPAKPGQR